MVKRRFFLICTRTFFFSKVYALLPSKLRNFVGENLNHVSCLCEFPYYTGIVIQAVANHDQSEAKQLGGGLMGLLDGVLGNASKIDPVKIQEEFSRILAPGEKVEHAYQLIRDYFVFTDKRFVLVDKQGLTGSKVEYHSIPYRSITHFSVETAGTFDLDAELKIWISSTEMPIRKQFNKKLSIYEVQSVLASYVLK
jgi:hypothetical protein